MGEEPPQSVPTRGPLFDPPRAVVPGLPELFGGGLGANAAPVPAPQELPRIEVPALRLPAPVEPAGAVQPPGSGAPWAREIADAASGVDMDAALGALKKGDIRGALAQIGGSASEIAAADTPAEFAAGLGETVSGLLTDEQRARLAAYREGLTRSGEGLVARVATTAEGSALVEAVRGDLRDGDWRSTRQAAATAARTAARRAAGTAAQKAARGFGIAMIAVGTVAVLLVLGFLQDM